MFEFLRRVAADEHMIGLAEFHELGHELVEPVVAKAGELGALLRFQVLGEILRSIGNHRVVSLH
jgi:hypothetical protein